MPKWSLPLATVATGLLLVAGCEREPSADQAPPPPPGISDPALTPAPNTLDHYGTETSPDTLVEVPIAAPDTF